MEVNDKAAGFAAVKPANRVLEINIYTENEEYIWGIAITVNSIWTDADGLLTHMIWKKIEKKFKVKQEDVIAEWTKLLQ